VEEILLLKFFPIVDTRLSCEDIARWWDGAHVDGDVLEIFCVLYFQRAARSTLQTVRPAFCIYTKATPCVEVW